jgi:hypothetical protein
VTQAALVTLEVVTGEPIISRISAETEEFQAQYSSRPSRRLLTRRMHDATALHRSFLHPGWNFEAVF